MSRPLDQIAYMLAADPPTTSSNWVGTVWDMALKGGWMMVPLALCSLLALTIIVERVLLTRKERVAPKALTESLRALRLRPGEAMARCKAIPSPLASVVQIAIQLMHSPADFRGKRVGEAGEREILVLRQRMRLLSSLPQAATMLGLLGTVVGMIRTFTVIASSGESLGKTERLAQGIYEAWTATAAGLFIAIPTLLAYHIILSRIDAAAATLDAEAAPWLEELASAPSLPTTGSFPESRVVEDDARVHPGTNLTVASA